MYSKDDIYIRYESIENVHEWHWLKHDTGAWEGPKNDWITSHRMEYFRHVKHFGTVIQAGGCLGMYPRLLSDIFQYVFTFEADPINFECLKLNCNKDNIYAYNFALGESNKNVGLFRRDHTNVGMHTIMDEPGDIPMTTLDDLSLNECDLICLDVEGHEARVLLGATDTLSRFSPVIICENGTQTIYNILRAFGYDEVGRSVSDTIYARK